MTDSFAVWLTGLPSSGKTTLAVNLAITLKERGFLVEILDGDDLRSWMSKDLGYSDNDRKEHAKRVIRLAQILIRNGIVALIPLVSPYQDSRICARQQLKPFVEVYVKCPIEECIRRDPKGLYSKAIRGEIDKFTGISDPYEEPECPEVTVDTHCLSVHSCTQLIVDSLRLHGLLT